MTKKELEQKVRDGANLYRADLSRANLSRANLYRADLSGADLYGADLSRANLSGANLSGADLYRANFTNTKYTKGAIIGKNPIQILGLQWWVFVMETHIQIGCEIHTKAEWASFTDEQIDTMESTALVFWNNNKNKILPFC